MDKKNVSKDQGSEKSTLPGEVDSKTGYILYPYRWIVLLAFFLTSASTGIVQASLSTNRPIITNAYPEASSGVL